MFQEPSCPAQRLQASGLHQQLLKILHKAQPSPSCPSYLEARSSQDNAMERPRSSSSRSGEQQPVTKTNSDSGKRQTDDNAVLICLERNLYDTMCKHCASRRWNIFTCFTASKGCEQNKALHSCSGLQPYTSLYSTVYTFFWISLPPRPDC